MIETKILPVSDLEKDRESIETAAAILREGGLVAIPTETVYGLAANALSPESVKKIFVAKGRPQDNPLIVHISQICELLPLVERVPPKAQKLMEHFWPGPLTMIFPKSEKVPLVTTGGLDTVAVRMPSHPVAQAIIQAAGVPLAAPSANLSGRPSTTTAQHCIHDLSGRVDAIVAADDCQVGVESTVVSMVCDPPKILRPGAVTREEMEEVIGPVDLDRAVTAQLEEGAVAASPGMKYKHYAPKAHVVIVEGDLEQYARFVNSQERPGVYGLVFQGEKEFLEKPCLEFGAMDDPAQQAHWLFAALREMDELGASEVYVRCPSKAGVGLAVYNRLLRAAAFEVITL